MRPKPLVLLILDGWGYNPSAEFNAIAEADTPFWDQLWAQSPHCLLKCSAEAVGLPPGQMGNSEVGHMTLGAGRVIQQDLLRINNAIADGSFFNNQTLVKAMHTANKNNAAVHFIGLTSPGGVHSHQNHLLALDKLARQCKVENSYIHAFLDGRDTPPKSALEYIQQIEATTNAKIATLIGRYYAMDRDENFARTEQAYNLLTNNQAKYHYSSATAAITAAYKRGETDEFIAASCILPVTINPQDIIINFNFRADRAKQLNNKLKNIISFKTAFLQTKPSNTLGEYIATHNLSQLRIAETEKYAHVTYFFNGGEEQKLNNEKRIIISSPKVATYDLKPEMSAAELTNKLDDAIKNQEFDVIICNYANADMVGHTGNFNAAIKAVATIDNCLQQIVTSIQKIGGEVMITADHGNIELMHDTANNQPHTSHTTSLVPLVYIGEKTTLQSTGTLADVAPTMLGILGLAVPPEMTGINLLS